MMKSNDIRERAYRFSIDVIDFVDHLPYDISGSVISKQLIRSATSVGANLIEAKSASSRKDFCNFYIYALKSANETVYWLGLLRDAKKFNSDRMISLIEEAKEISRMIGSCILKLKKQPKDSTCDDTISAI